MSSSAPAAPGPLLSGSWPSPKQQPAASPEETPAARKLGGSLRVTAPEFSLAGADLADVPSNVVNFEEIQALQAQQRRDRSNSYEDGNVHSSWGFRPAAERVPLFVIQQREIETKIRENCELAEARVEKEVVAAVASSSSSSSVSASLSSTAAPPSSRGGKDKRSSRNKGARRKPKRGASGGGGGGGGGGAKIGGGSGSKARSNSSNAGNGGGSRGGRGQSAGGGRGGAGAAGAAR